ncbi:MAG: sulfatase-like hydrolase/transferase [Planctomycetaceae bacterium]|nr:sulfatase-like hydrolase/transferase [Planctomycetaceae bacterium]
MQHFLRCVFVVVIAVLGIPSVRLNAADRPSFVWLISEDNSFHWLRLYMPSGAPTPNIEQLATHGLTFQHAFSNAPVCSVARTTLMTSCYAPRIGTQFHRRTVEVPLPGSLRMFPAYLRDAGYYTTNNNKKDYNAIEGQGVWDESSRKASWRGRRVGQPFFHMQSFATSHESSLHFPAADVSEKPTKTDPETVQLAPYHPDTPTFRYTYARYLDRIQDIDQQIGAVVDQLEADGLLEETFVFYFGDHGGVLPRGKGYAYESGLHVPLVVRVPEKWKHLVPAPPGERIEGFVSFIDFGPTLLNLAGIAVPDEVDGRPFLGSSVTRSELDKRDEALGYADRFDEKYDFVRTLRKGRFEYVRRFEPFYADGLQNNYRYRMAAYQEWRTLYLDGKLNATQSQFFEPGTAEALYDLTADPWETVNLAADPDHRETLLKLRQRMEQIQADISDLSFVPESDLVEQAFENPEAFTKANHDRLREVQAIAALQCEAYPAVRERLKTALQSKDPWVRHQAAIVATTFGAQASDLQSQVMPLLTDDESPLVRVRAAEFLAIVCGMDVAEQMTGILESARSGVEAALILNSIVMLRDGPARLKFDLSTIQLAPSIRKNDSVARRLEYLLQPL